MSRGRATSIYILSTKPLGGMWIPPRKSKPQPTQRRWYWDGHQVVWEPHRPEDAHLREQTVERILALISRTESAGPAAYIKLSGTSKTGITWSLPAVASCPAIDETCENCYALDGFYRTNIAAQLGRIRRLEYLKGLLAAARIEEWIRWISGKISALKLREAVPGHLTHPTLQAYLQEHDAIDAVAYFRWHDSGDIFHGEYAAAILEVCRRTPKVLHWLPTRMGSLLASIVEHGQRIPPNLAVQVSCHHGGRLEKSQKDAIRRILTIQPEARVGVTYAHAGPRSREVDMQVVLETYGDTVTVCPATLAKDSTDRICVGCRRCWAQAMPNRPIIYVVHKAD